MKIKFLFLSSILFSAITAQAVVVEDFESYEVGQTLQLWNVWGNTPSGTGKVELDPANSKNKVLHVKVNGWGTFYGAKLPADLQGTALIQKKDFVTFDLYRTASDNNDYKGVQVYQGSALLYGDDGYPHQGNKAQWQSRTYWFDKTKSPNGAILAMGFNSDNSDYLIDNIAVKDLYEDYVVVANDTVIDFGGQNSADAYKSYNGKLNVLAGAKATFYTARYSNFNPSVIGQGEVNIYSGGERTYLGEKDKAYPDWNGFTGDVHVYPHTKYSGSNGFYGLVLAVNGKTMNPERAQDEAADGRMNVTFRHSNVTLHKGATLTIDGSSSNRGACIGHLQTEAGSTLSGYYKSKDGVGNYYLIGGSDRDAVLAGRIAPNSDNKKMPLGLIKEGKGTYRITGNTNLISGGVRVLEGRVLFNNDAAAAQTGKLSGSTGTPADASTVGVNVMLGTSIGGTGSIATSTNVYGSVEPGDDGIGHLTIADYAANKSLKLIVRPMSTLQMQIASAADYDQLTVNGAVSYYNIQQDFATSERMPRLSIELLEGAELQVGDEFTLLTATGKESYGDVEWKFKVLYPMAYSWKVEQKATDSGFRVVARVTSLEYSGQGDANDDDNVLDEEEEDEVVLDLAAEQKNTTPLRSFAESMSNYVGTCAPVYRLELWNENNARTKLIANQFNAVVAENEMKFDATEPNRDDFSYDSGDALIDFAEKHQMYVRGHALAWHSQVPGWLSSDGKKNSFNYSRAELLSILKNHITKVVGHWRGRVHEWDVANEVLADDQTSIRSNPQAYDLRPSVWYTGIGEDFLDSAFVWAHQADPAAKLILNDYDVEAKGTAKGEALFNLATRLRNSGIPIDGVGLQCHLDAGYGFSKKIDANIARYKEADFLCRITELDLGIDANTAENLQQQADDFYRLAHIAMKHENCGMLMIWGLTDDMTWRNGRRPLLYDSNNQAKPAYWATHAALREAAAEAMGIDQEDLSIRDSWIDSAPVFNLQGQPVQTLQRGQLYVQVGRRFVVR